VQILFTSDWHIGCNRWGITNAVGVNTRLADVTATIDKIISFAANNADCFIMGGDVFHTSRPTVEQQLIFLHICYKLEQLKIPSRFIVGNHDWSAIRTCGHALALFKQLEGFEYVKIYDQTTHEIINDVDFCFYPYHADAPKWPKDAPRMRMLVCHSHLQGAVVGAEPFEINDDAAFKYKGLPVDAVLAGHFHKPQLLSKSKPLALYPGSIQPVDFSERHDTKGVVLIDSQTLEIRCAGFKTRPLYQVDIVGCDELQKSYLDETFFACQDAICKVNVQLNQQDAHLFDENKIRGKLFEQGAHNIASINLKIERDTPTRDSKISFDSDIGLCFSRYAASNQLGDEVIDYGKAIINEICNIK
jgi:DNA repair protein SbcD/Mre11